jgi:nicotinate-nucleotide adenylyltransferase
MVLQIALFGTSADPPTYGHLEILTWLTKRFDRVAVWASDNPFKRDQTPLVDRTEMLRLVVTLSGKPLEKLRVYPELSYPRTIHTLLRAQKIWKDAKFTFVMGADLLPQLPTWYKATDLLQTANLLVIPRSGYQITDQAIDKIKTLGGTIEIANLITPDVSSSAYRHDMAPNTVPTIVQSYIQQENLYPCPVL